MSRNIKPKNWKYANVVPTSGWRGAFTVIREASLRSTPHGIRLIQQPIPELRALRLSHHQWRNQMIRPGANILSGIRGKSLEILAEFLIAGSIECFGLRVRTGETEGTLIQYRPAEKQLQVDRTRSGRVDFSEDFAAVHSAELPPIGNVVRLHIFTDSSSIEVFANDGHVVFSESIFPAEESQGLELFARGGNILLPVLDLHHLKPAGFRLSKK